MIFQSSKPPAANSFPWIYFCSKQLDVDGFLRKMIGKKLFVSLFAAKEALNIATFKKSMAQNKRKMKRHAAVVHHALCCSPWAGHVGLCLDLLSFFLFPYTYGTSRLFSDQLTSSRGSTQGQKVLNLEKYFKQA